MTLRALIADDMPLARQHLRRHLLASGRAEVVVECASGAPVAQAVQDHHPDVLFLDVQMPGVGGFDALAMLDAVALRPAPQIVFVTAFAEYALRAFDARAADYLLKPVDPARLAQALDRVQALRAAASATPPAALRLRIGGGWRMVSVAEVQWVQARGNALVVALGHERLITRMTLAAFEAALPAPGLLRIHRSTLVQQRRISAVLPRVNGDQQVTLDDGTVFTASRRYRGAVLAALGG